MRCVMQRRSSETRANAKTHPCERWNNGHDRKVSGENMMEEKAEQGVRESDRGGVGIDAAFANSVLHQFNVVSRVRLDADTRVATSKCRTNSYKRGDTLTHYSGKQKRPGRGRMTLSTRHMTALS